MTSNGNEIETFRGIYEKHVAGVAAGDMETVLADMVRANLPTVFDGVDIPRGSIETYEIIGVRADGEQMVGETVYRTKAGVIGLRSIWDRHDDRWLAAELANFPVPGSGAADEVAR
ncbi:hypothetical protein GII33_19875 [Gordonia pseudamarae]|jgi:hypothetical protein|uniref:SnoaL-like domain-containing protein n=1 Tax=Gordonia pseudamarae TaxID=2831662 RepID=A0ABX6ILG2_9ACTN|nr:MULTISPECIES: hypothetical protein [Gordonia]MBD0024469.1 hypothetical protein [Gordonia sp. (in: high G+C Gram-positive bacteria)]QHN27900.1 hypothetical protein GII33_19875 [Gordonia pseudamarae]QHN36757.1 hypothetical protein GII31_19485 [Gordonia pseudamarae]